MILVFDTETTGKAEFRLPPAHPNQPRLVQLGAILLDEEFHVKGEINLIVKPDGYEIPDEASNIHGITTEIATKCGLPFHTVLSAFLELSKSATKFVCHNYDFDSLVMASACTRATDCVGMTAHFRDGSFCTMRAMTAICKLPGSYGDYKWPKLQEAYKFAFNEEFEGAHDAMADVRACARLYRWLLQREQEPEQDDDGVPLDPKARGKA